MIIWENYDAHEYTDGFIPLTEGQLLLDDLNKQFKRKAAKNYVKMKAGNFGRAVTFRPRTPVTKGRVAARTLGEMSGNFLKGNF
jgi:hypothetical protein